jgi:hypothetical protein
MKKQRHHYELEYKRRIVQEYLAGVVSAEELARREADAGAGFQLRGGTRFEACWKNTSATGAAALAERYRRTVSCRYSTTELAGFIQ